MRVLSMFLGLLLMAAGAFWIFLLHGFALMSSPGAPGAEPAPTNWSKIASDGMFPLGILQIIVGACLMFRRSRQNE